MSGFLFEHVVFGPIKSRRLGISLGLNLLPENEKRCTFNCLYCECGWTFPKNKWEKDYPSHESISLELKKRLENIKNKESHIDAITFAGNGEPTIHPDFLKIMTDTVRLRDKYFSDAKIVVLSNGSMSGDENIKKALLMADINMLKLDAGTEETFQKINNPFSDTTLDEIIKNYKKFNGNFTIQTLFVRASLKDEFIDNTTSEEVEAWLEHLKVLKPKSVTIYPIAREAPLKGVEKVSFDVLEKISDKVKKAGFKVDVYY